MYQDIKERTFQFGLRIIFLSENLPSSRAGNVVTRQILRSGTSVGANVEEAVAAYSRNEYAYKMGIALKEARETHYWLRLIEGSKMTEKERVADIMNETDEIKKVLGSIVSKLRGKSKK